MRTEKEHSGTDAQIARNDSMFLYVLAAGDFRKIGVTINLKDRLFTYAALGSKRT